jgi:hypothetical protein
MSISYPILRDRVSPARLAPYAAATGAIDDSTVALYEWNMAMSTAMFQDLGAFEILLRNAMDLSLRAKYQPTAAAAPWYSQVPLTDRAKETLALAMDRAAGNSGVAPIQDKVVAELTFGFWRYLLGSRYQASVWPCVLRYSFTNVQPGEKVQRKAVEDIVLSLYLLRNRIAHHEPIFDRDLIKSHGQLLSMAGWICPVTSAWILERSQVPIVMAEKPLVSS